MALAVGGLSGRVFENDEAAPKDRGLETATNTAATCLSNPGPKRGCASYILSDSMGIGGWAEELDACFRSCPGVTEVHTIVACGANPLTWMKMAPYAHASTRCGFLRMETVAGKSKPDQEKDYYGMTKGHKPAAHKVLKSRI